MQRVCVIGMGHIGNLHARAYKACKDAELVGVCDINPERAKAASLAHGVPYYLDVIEMLNDLKPDLCSVATGGFEYSSDHFLPTMQALDFGCHVLCEKPISNDLVCAKKMVDKAEEKGVCFALDFNHRFTPAARCAEQWMKDGKIGDLLFCNMALWIGRPGDFETPFYHLKALNPHSIDIMRHFMGDIEEVSCFAMTAPTRKTLYSTASWNMRFKCGAVGHLTSSYDIRRDHPMERCEVAGTLGRFVFEDMWRQATLYPSTTLMKEVYTNPVFDGYSNFDDTFFNRIHTFVKQVDEGAAPHEIDGTGRDGLEASRVIHAAIASIKAGGKVIKVADITE